MRWGRQNRLDREEVREQCDDVGASSEDCGLKRRDVSTVCQRRASSQPKTV